MPGEGVIVSVLVAAATSLVVALAALFQYRRVYARPPQAYLYRRDGRRVVKHGLDRSVIRIGRHPDNEIQLHDRSVSRFHAQIIDKQNGSFLIRDLDSKNGVRIFYRRITSSVLTDGDVLFIGKVGMRFIHYPADYATVPDTVELETGMSRRLIRRQRRVERFGAGRPVRFYTDAAGWVTGTARDISEEGIFIETPRRLPVRMPLDIVIKGDHNGQWFKLAGDVVRSDDSGIAVNFTDVDRATKTDLYQMSKAAATDSGPDAARTA
ncbi:MAG: FHA domain-containing protein [Arenicellales bacterium]